MRHCRYDYETIQPHPTPRPHWLRVDGLPISLVGATPQLVESAERLGEPIIPDDEPVFILRAKDVLGPALVEAWAVLSEAIGGDPITASRVRAWAVEMGEYAAKHYGGGKVADTPSHLLRDYRSMT